MFLVLSGEASDQAPPTTVPRAPPGMTVATGTAETIRLEPTLLPSLPVPLTIEPAARGAASGSITGAAVDGVEQSIAWPGGTPLVVEAAQSAELSLTFDPLTVEIGPGELVARAGGGSALLSPGRYLLTGSVAVGEAGLGRPQDTVSFEATETTTFTVSGEALLRIPAGEWTRALRRLEGPGAVTMTGDLAVTDASGARSGVALRFGPGPYRVEYGVEYGVENGVENGALVVDARFEGDVTVDP